MRGVRHHADGDHAAVQRTVGSFRTEVVLHVAGSLDRPDVPRILELMEDLRVGLADDVGQHIEPTPVCHTDDGFPHPVPDGAEQQGVEQHDRRLAAFERIPFLSHVLGLQECLESLCRTQPVENLQLFGDVRWGLRRFDPLLDPAAFLRALDVHVLGADGAAVRLLQRLQHVAKRHGGLPREPVDDELSLQVIVPEPECRELEFRMRGHPCCRERVGIGHQMSADSIRLDERGNADRFDGRVVRVVGALLRGRRAVACLSAGRGDRGGEQLSPGPVDRAGVVQVSLVLFVHEPFVDAEFQPVQCRLSGA